jgi:PilZ domain
VARLLVRPLLRKRAALLRDLSADGAGLLLADPVEPGAALLIQLHGSSPGSVLTLAARVVHATRQPDGNWLVGCRLAARLRGGAWDRALRLEE